MNSFCQYRDRRKFNIRKYRLLNDNTALRGLKLFEVCTCMLRFQRKKHGRKPKIIYPESMKYHPRYDNEPPKQI